MKIKTVTYQKTFPLAQFVNEKISAEVELQDGDSPEEALANAKSLVEKFHKDTNPQLYSNLQQTNGVSKENVPVIAVKKEDTPEEKQWRARMAAVTKPEELFKWKTKCPKHIYEARLEELTN
jgi:hypothetical protein